MTRRSWFLTVPAALALSAAPLLAEADPLEPPDLARYVRWGFLRARPTVTFSNFGYDDNIFYRTGDAPKQGDYTARISPSLAGLVLLGDRAFLTFDEKIDITAYLEFTEESYAEQRGSARLTIPFGSMGVYVDGALNRTQERPVDVQDIRARKNEDKLGAGVILKLGWRTDVEIGQSHNRITNSDPDFGTNSEGLTIEQLLDRVEEGGRLRARYKIAGKTRLTLDAGRTTATFDDQTVQRDSVDERVLPGVDFGEGGTLSGSLRYGYANLDSKAPELSDYYGPVWDAKVAYRGTSRTTLQVGGKRQVGFAIYLGNQYYLNRTYDLRLIHYVNRSIGFEAGGGLGRLDFPDSLRQDRIDTYDLGIRLRLRENDLGRRLEYSFKYTTYRQDSNVDSFDQSRSSLGFGAVVGY
jgi:hypothetical protein